MVHDTRRLTVSRDHLRTAYDEITSAQGHTERSMVEGALERARAELDLVLRKLDDERGKWAGSEMAPAVERAYASTQRAWQGVHDCLRAPENISALQPIASGLMEALGAVDEAEQVGEEREALHK